MSIDPFDRDLRGCIVRLYSGKKVKIPRKAKREERSWGGVKYDINSECVVFDDPSGATLDCDIVWTNRHFIPELDELDWDKQGCISGSVAVPFPGQTIDLYSRGSYLGRFVAESTDDETNYYAWVKLRGKEGYRLLESWKPVNEKELL